MENCDAIECAQRYNEIRDCYPLSITAATIQKAVTKNKATIVNNRGKAISLEETKGKGDKLRSLWWSSDGFVVKRVVVIVVMATDPPDAHPRL